jgi:hypothetical protein
MHDRPVACALGAVGGRLDDGGVRVHRGSGDPVLPGDGHVEVGQERGQVDEGAP